MLEISRDNKRCVFASNLVLSSIFTATLSVMRINDWMVCELFTINQLLSSSFSLCCVFFLGGEAALARLGVLLAYLIQEGGPGIVTQTRLTLKPAEAA